MLIPHAKPGHFLKVTLQFADMPQPAETRVNENAWVCDGPPVSCPPCQYSWPKTWHDITTSHHDVRESAGSWQTHTHRREWFYTLDRWRRMEWKREWLWPPLLKVYNSTESLPLEWNNNQMVGVSSSCAQCRSVQEFHKWYLLTHALHMYGGQKWTLTPGSSSSITMDTVKAKRLKV